MKVVCFRYWAKFGHFLRAEANANGVTYPVPPRTVLLGLLGGLLGLEKDQPQQILGEALIAVGGEVPKRFWHKTNVRKDPPAPLPFRVKIRDKGTSKEQRNFRFPQEWLWRPEYRVWASLPESHHDQLVVRLRDGRWHFTPCMGLSEMLANVELSGESEASPLPSAMHWVCTVTRQEAGKVDTPTACQNQLALQTLRMPWRVTADRVFSHRTYFLEHKSRPFPIDTAEAWQCGDDIVVFL